MKKIHLKLFPLIQLTTDLAAYYQLDPQERN